MKIRDRVGSWLEQLWYDHERTPPAPLILLETLFKAIVRHRQKRVERGHAPAQRLPVPVIVVGNLSVGGTGKTPFTVWLARLLVAHGWRPGIITRGYGGHQGPAPIRILDDTPYAVAGDEALLLATRTQRPVAVCRQRVAAARLLVDTTDVNILLADDGLQHYALGRDLEIALIDGTRGLGNGHCLPAGPLREPPERLKRVDWLVYTGEAPEGEIRMHLKGDLAVALDASGTTRPLGDFKGRSVRAVAGIGNPDRFFTHLRRHGLDIIEAPFPDHHPFTRNDLDVRADEILLMTEKDAMRCRSLTLVNAYYVPVDAELPDVFSNALVQQLKHLNHGQQTA